jgi:hypothetical protein
LEENVDGNQIKLNWCLDPIKQENAILIMPSLYFWIGFLHGVKLSLVQLTQNLSNFYQVKNLMQS